MYPRMEEGEGGCAVGLERRWGWGGQQRLRFGGALEWPWDWCRRGGRYDSLGCGDGPSRACGVELPGLSAFLCRCCREWRRGVGGNYVLQAVLVCGRGSGGRIYTHVRRTTESVDRYTWVRDILSRACSKVASWGCGGAGYVWGPYSLSVGGGSGGRGDELVGVAGCWGGDEDV